MERVKGYCWTFLPCGFLGGQPKPLLGQRVSNRTRHVRKKEMEVQFKCTCRKIRACRGCEGKAEINLYFRKLLKGVVSTPLQVSYCSCVQITLHDAISPVLFWIKKACMLVYTNTDAYSQMHFPNSASLLLPRCPTQSL